MPSIRVRMTPHFWGGVALVLAIMRPLGRMMAFSNWLTTAE